MMLTLKIRTAKETISMSVPDTMTLGELKDEIADKAGIDYDFDLLGGFPLKTLSFSDDDAIEGRVQNNEVMRVQAKELAGQQSQGKGVMKQPRKRTSKAKPSASSALSAPAAVRAPAPTPSGSSFGARIATLHGPSTRAPSRPRQTSRRAPRTQRLSSDDSAGTEADISEHLLSAVSGGGTKRDKILRKVFRDAVEYQYNSSKAVGRLHAVYSGQYQVTPVATARVLGTGQSSQLEVTFSRGAGLRGTYTETVDLLGEEILRELIRLALQDTEGAGREVLKPMNLAKCSPRIFWSLVHRHGNNLLQAVQHYIPAGQDTSWLTERKRELSEKAKENAAQEAERQQRLQSRKRTREPSTEGDADQAGSKKPSATATSASTSSATAAATVPAAGSASKPAAVSAETLSPRMHTMFSSVSLKLAVPENAVEAVSEALVSVNSAHGSAPLLVLMASTKPELLFQELQHTQATSLVLSLDQVEHWRESAQVWLLQQLWQQVCGGGSDHLRAALHSLRIRMPSELLLWRSAPAALLSALLKHNPNLKHIPYFWPATIAPGAATEDTLAVRHVEWMIDIGHEVAQTPLLQRWIKQYSSCVPEEDEEEDNEEDQEEGKEGEEQEKDESTEEWQSDPSAHPFISRKCRIVLSGSNDVDTTCNAPLGWWTDGTITSYLPPTEEEPMALWRVTLDAASASSGGKADVEDLEEEEVNNALRLFEQATQGH